MLESVDKSAALQEKSRNPPLPQKKDRVSSGELKEVRHHRSFSSFRAVGALFLREMQTSGGRATGGYLWAIAEPVGGIVILTLIFSAVLRTPSIGVSFPLFYATGVLPFMGYMAISSAVASSISYSKPLLSYPAVTFMDALLARILFNSLTQIAVAMIILSGIIYYFDTRADPQVDKIALSFLMMVALSAGIGTINCFMFSAFPVWVKIWSILMRPIFLISGIFFVYDDLPEPFRSYIWWNPLIHVVGEMRRAFYPSYTGDYISHSYLFGLSLVCAAIGLALLVRFHRDLQYS